MIAPTTRVRSCNLRSDWDSNVEDNGSPITGYKVEIQGADSQFYQAE
jgi:hypothetical protein